MILWCELRLVIYAVFGFPILCVWALIVLGISVLCFGFGFGF